MLYMAGTTFFHNLHPTESPAQRGSSLASNGHARIQEKKIQSSNRFLDDISWNMTTAALRHADLPQFRQLH